MATITSTTALGATALTSFNPLDPVGSILDGALNDVENAMTNVTNKVHDAALDVILKAADRVAGLITSLKVAYAESLEKTYNDADKLLRENIDRVNDLVKDIINENEKALEAVADRVETIVKLSPLSNWYLPLLNEVSPPFIAVDGNATDGPFSTTSALVIFKGNFAFADRAGYTPTLKIADRTYTPDGNATKELKFIIQINSNDPKLDMNRFSYFRGILSVTWKSSWLQWWPTTSQYTTLHGLLPATVGKISVVYTKAESMVVQTYKSAIVNVARSKNHWKTDTIVASPHDGWHVVRGTSSLHWLTRRGQTGDQFVSDDHDQVIWNYSRKDGDGSVQLYFDESQTIPASQRTEEKNDLRWGNSWMATPRSDEKITRIVLEAFNGDLFAFHPITDHSNPFVELREFEGVIQIKAKKASELNQGTIGFNRSMFALKGIGDKE